MTGAQADDATFTMSNIFDGSNQTATVTTPVAATVTTNASKSNAKDGKLGSTNNYFEVVLTSDQFTAVSINGYINSGDKSYNWGFQFSTDGGATWSEEVTQANDGDKTSHDIAVGATIPANANGFRVIRKAGSSTVVNSITLTLEGGGDPSDTRTNLVGAWSAATSTFDFGSTATAPTFDVTGGTLGTDYSVAYSLTTDGGNVTVNSTSGITAIDTNTPGTSKVKATITVINETDYKATTTEYETTITVKAQEAVLTATNNYFWKFSNTGWPTGDIAETTIIDNMKVYASSSKKVNIATVNATVGTETFSRQLKFGGTGNSSERSVQVKVIAPCTITLYGASASTSNERTCNIALESFSNVVATLTTTTASSISYDVEGSGEKDIFIYSANSGFNIYGVKVESSVPSTDPVITASNASISATESGVAATQTIDVTGANLTGSTLTATLNPAVTGLSVQLASDAISEGSITTTATLSYTATENAHGTTTLTFSDGTTTKDVTITYNAHVADYVQKTVSAATTWDFSKCASSDIELVDEQNRTDVLIANVTGYTLNSDFDAESMIINGDRLVYNGNCSQILKLKFKTTVPGTVQVTFSNTGGSRPYRYVKVNNTMSSEGSCVGTANDKTSEAILVAAGDVEITGYIPDATDPQDRDGDVVGPTFLRVYKVIFTPLADDVVVLDDQNDNNATTIENNTGSDKTVTVIRNLSPDYYNTIFLPFAMTTAQIKAAFGEGAQVATFTGMSGATQFGFGNVTAMEANVPYLVKPTQEVNGFTVEGVTISNTTADATVDGGYAMVGNYDTFTNGGSTGGGSIGISIGGSSSSSANEIYYFTKSNTIKKLTSTGSIKGLRAFMVKLPAGKTSVETIVSNAGIKFGGAGGGSARARQDFVLYLDDDNTTTGIDSIDNSQLTIDNDAPAYNLAGQKVGKGYKGIVIINGKKVVK